MCHSETASGYIKPIGKNTEPCSIFKPCQEYKTRVCISYSNPSNFLPSFLNAYCPTIFALTALTTPLPYSLCSHAPPPLLSSLSPPLSLLSLLSPPPSIPSSLSHPPSILSFAITSPYLLSSLSPHGSILLLSPHPALLPSLSPPHAYFLRSRLTLPCSLYQHTLPYCSARDWDGKDYLRLIPRVVW